MGKRITNRTASDYYAKGDRVMVRPGVTTYSDGSSATGMRWPVLHVAEHISPPTARERLAELTAKLLNASPEALEMVNG